MSALPKAPLTSNDPIEPEDVQTEPGPVLAAKYTDDAVLRIVLRDYDEASAWLANSNFLGQWKEAQLLYQSPRSFSTFEGSGVPRSSVPRFHVAKQVNSLAPAIYTPIFADATPVQVRPRGNTTEEAATAWRELLTVLLEDCDFKQELCRGIETMVTQGTAIFKAGWEVASQVELHYKRTQAPPTVDLPLQTQPMPVITEDSDEFEPVETEVTRSRPWFEVCELGSVFVDPKWNKPNQLWKARYVIHQDFVTYDDLKRMAQSDAFYELPSEEVLRAMVFEDEEQTQPLSGPEHQLTEEAQTDLGTAARRDRQTSADPLEKPFEVLEWWSETECRVVLQRKIVLRNDLHNLPSKPFFAANFWNLQDTGYGIGVGRIAGADQRIDQGTTNAALDIIAYSVNPEYAVSRGANVPVSDMRRRLGGIRVVDGDARAAFALIDSPKVPSDVWTVAQMSREASESATGADQASVQGSMPAGRSSFGRSGTGAGIIGKASNVRLQAPLDRVIDGVMLPFFGFIWQMVKESMPVSEIRSILTDVTANALVVDMYDFLNARMKWDTLAGTRLAAHQAMSTALPFLLNVFENPQIVNQLNQTGYKIDVHELVEMVMDVSEWRNARTLVRQMTPDEQQKYQASQQQNPLTEKMQLQSSAIQQKAAADQQLEEQKIHGRLVTQTVKQLGEHATQSPLDRAASFAQRDSLEQTINAGPYFGGAQ